jgi:GGDEF domain-containing protein
VDQHHEVKPVSGTFLARAGIELSRAERYRIFICLTELDLGFTRDIFGEEESLKLMERIHEVVRNNVRDCDYSAFVNGRSLCLLFPETSRQGAEVASRRVSEVIRKELARHTDKPLEAIIPVELASYPDAAGAKTIKEFLKELQKRNRN